MKIEVGESLLLSWLQHIKECQIVQTNWKASNKWQLSIINGEEYFLCSEWYKVPANNDRPYLLNWMALNMY